MSQHVSRREDQLEGDAKLELAVLAGQLVALREGLGKTLPSSRLCHIPVIAEHACPVTHSNLPPRQQNRSHAPAQFETTSLL